MIMMMRIRKRMMFDDDNDDDGDGNCDYDDDDLQVMSWLSMHNFPHGLVSFADGFNVDPLRLSL